MIGVRRFPSLKNRPCDDPLIAEYFQAGSRKGREM
jgi:hypothetical protein